MILLSGRSAVPSRKVPLEALNITLKERDSTATMTPADMTGIDVNSWLQDDTEPGRGIVWRVKSITNAFHTNTPTVNMEHAINLLKDKILFGEVKPSTITGRATDTTCTALQAIRYILNQQSDWILDAFDYQNVYGAYKFDGDTLYDALVTVCGTLPDCWWSYNMNVYPFRLSIKRRSDTPDCELRPGRNLRTISKSIDKSGMYTRFYPIGYDDLELPEKYIDRNTAAYGIICKSETNTALDTESELRGWANERLHDHADPVVTITVEALDLSEATGEPMDHMKLGLVCRVPLTEYGTTLLERITQISIPDKVNQPEAIKLTLCNSRTDVSTIIADLIKSSSKTKRQTTKQSKEDHAWFTDTNDKVSMTAKSIIGVDAQGNANWERLSELVVDGTGIHAMVKSVQGDLVIANTRIDQNEEEIKLEATRREEGDITLHSAFTVRADAIEARVETSEGDIATLTVRANGIEGRVTNAEGNIGTLTVKANAIESRVTTAEGNIGTLTVTANAIESRVTTAEGNIGSLTVTANAIAGRVTTAEGNIGTLQVTAQGFETRIQSAEGYYSTIESSDRRIGLIVGTSSGGDYIKAGEITLAINNAGESEAHIDANKVYIGNSKSTTVINGKCSLSDVTASIVKSRIADISSLTTQAISGTTAAYDNIYGGTFKFRTSSGSGYAYTDFKDLFVTSLALSLIGNTYTLKSYNANATETVVGTFSRATSLSEGWSSGNFPLTITASPQGNTKSIGFTNASDVYLTLEGNGTPTQYGSSKKLINVPYKVVHHGGTGVGDQDRYTGSLAAVDATSVYNYGWADSYDDIGLNYSSNQTIAPGGQITIYPAAKATPTASHSAIITKGITVNATSPAPTDIKLWSNDSGSWVEITSPYQVNNQMTVTPWCNWNGTDYAGSAITLTPKSDPHHKVSDVKFAVAAQDMGNNRIKYTLTATIPDGGSSWITAGDTYTLYV